MRFTDRIYAEVNDTWPKTLPKLRPEEAMRAAKRLYRFALGRPWKGPTKITSGRNYTWIRRGELFVNASRGWKTMVHDMSHLCHNRISTERPHSEEHAQLELKMVRFVVECNWLDGILQPAERPVPSPSEKLEAKLKAIELKTKRWESKAKRAATALKKLKIQRRSIERRINTNVN